MPLIWTVDHASRTIRATATGPLTTHDLAYYMAGIGMDHGQGYRAVFDARHALFELSTADLNALSFEVQRRKRAGDGAIAVVTDSIAEHEMAAHFVRRTADARPCRLFDGMDDAEAWLESLGPPGR